ncbi:FCD domain-containing protein [Microbacterium sp. CIAB417]|uniref:FadR/GntR family transcriptional regulator n=1 Tax=Microbacterium sp. CIAB417 TaxID=2860287 RepID=UPI0027E32CED|nr:FCD domain-containing protein [Microbacterium sp. CIAB417]
MTEPEETPPSGNGDLRGIVLDTLGHEICDGLIATGATFTTESIQTRFEVSRSVVREALHALEALGLISAKRRVGVRVLPESHWNGFDLQVIRWRLAGRGRIAQLRSLTELRGAIEPAAARLAAVRAPLEGAGDLVGVAGRLWAAGREGDADAFLHLDARFHRLVLEMSGNEMFAQLHPLVEEVMRGRTRYGLMPQHPAPEALQWHIDIATAIQAGEADRAAAAMSAITERSLAEMSSIWGRDTGDGFTART